MYLGSVGVLYLNLASNWKDLIDVGSSNKGRVHNSNYAARDPFMILASTFD